MLVPGVYTTPEIGAKCRKYARARRLVRQHRQRAPERGPRLCKEALGERDRQGKDRLTS